jgi:CRP-like cAMP-binding protein
MDVDSVKTALQLCELFTSLDDSDLDVLMKNGEVKELPRGKILYMKGAKSDDTFCLIVSGSMNIVAKDGHVVKEIGESEVIGEVALSNPYKIRTVTVIAKEPTEILEWNINHIKEKIPGLWKKLLKLAWKKMSDYYEE